MSSNNESTASLVTLCTQCATHLTLETSTANKKIFNSDENTWPGFIWSFISDEHLQNIYGTHLWKFIPTTWRYWWIENARHLFSEPISIDIPHSVFVDKTKEINEWDSDIESMSIARLRDTTNKHLMPCVLCPWGCSEFYHK